MLYDAQGKEIETDLSDIEIDMEQMDYLWIGADTKWFDIICFGFLFVVLILTVLVRWGYVDFLK